MEPQGSTPEFSDVATHAKTWHVFTSFMLRGIIGVVVLIVFLGLITGVL